MPWEGERAVTRNDNYIVQITKILITKLLFKLKNIFYIFYFNFLS